MWGVLEDIFCNRCMLVWQDALASAAVARGEFRILTCDGTQNVAMALVGYQRARKVDGSMEVGDGAWEPDQQRTCIYTVRGATGFTVGTPLLNSERSDLIARALADLVPSGGPRDEVQYIVVDYCQSSLWKELQGVFPNPFCLCEDPIHLVMKYKSGFGHKSSPGSRFLSAIMKKFSVACDGEPSKSVAWPWVWGQAPQPSGKVSSLRAHLRRQDLPHNLVKEAEGLVYAPNARACYRDFVLSMAALCTRYSTEVTRRRVGKKGKLLINVIAAACAFGRWGSYVNNVHLRTRARTWKSALISTGTTANEAFHAEIRSAFRQVYNIHLPTMEARLRLLVCESVICMYHSTHPISHVNVVFDLPSPFKRVSVATCSPRGLHGNLPNVFQGCGRWTSTPSSLGHWLAHFSTRRSGRVLFLCALRALRCGRQSSLEERPCYDMLGRWRRGSGMRTSARG